MAATFLEADVPALLRLAETVAMTALEDRFGLNPKSRRALQWEIGQAEPGATGPVADVPKLRVVDGG